MFLDLLDTDTVLFEDQFALVDDIELLLLGQVVSRVQLIVSLVFDSQALLVLHHIESQEVGTFQDDLLMGLTSHLREHPRGFSYLGAEETTSCKQQKVHHMHVC